MGVCGLINNVLFQLFGLSWKILNDSLHYLIQPFAQLLHTMVEFD